ncbi:NAD(P)-dependent oxidoreductase [Streptomyces rubrogriseus]|uniref:NAD(P)-dependent oxidoreductase n=1 Tax=Streptomyces rubrogriseus TaxID=194673 RepID=UPI0036C294CA
MTAKLTVSVLGTGIMGAAMARSLARAGHTVRAWNRSRAKAEPLAADGAIVVDSPAEAVRDADVVLTMLHDSAAVVDVMRQAAPALRRGTAWVQSTTVGIDDITALGAFADELGLVLFDAPVSGTRSPAEAGQLLILAAGPVEHRRSVAPVLDAVGVRTVWTGQDGAAGTSTRLKLVVNSWVIAASVAAGEIVSLAHAIGVDPRSFFDLIEGGGLDMPLLRAKAGLILNGDVAPAQFAVNTAAKDARLIVEAGARHGVRLDLAAASAERLDRAAARGHAQEDLAAAYYAGLAGQQAA